MVVPGSELQADIKRLDQHLTALKAVLADPSLRPSAIHLTAEILRTARALNRTALASRRLRQ